MLPALLAAAPGLLSAVGGIAGLFKKKPKYNNPANAANPYLDQIAGQAQPYYQPYQQAGNAALGKVQGAYDQQLNDPGAVYNQLAGGYKESPGYQFKLQQAMNAQGNASARGGMLGTPMDAQNAATVGNGIASQDFNDYLSQVMGLRTQGLAGEQGLESQGYGANTDFANLLAQITGQKAANAYNGAAGQNSFNQGSNAADSANWGNVASGLGAAATGYNSYNQQQKFMDWLQRQNIYGGGS